MPFNELFLLLLGGYLVFTQFNGTKFRASGFPAQRIIFPAATLGLALYLAARLLQILAAHVQESVDYWLSIFVGQILPAAAIVLLAVTLRNTMWRLQEWRETEQVRLLGALLKSVSTTLGQRQVFHAILATAGTVLLLVLVLNASEQTFWRFLYSAAPYVIGGYIMVVAASRTLHRLTSWPIPSLSYRIATVLLLLASSAPSLVLHTDKIANWWGQFTPIPNIGTTVLALALAFAAFSLGNRVLTPEAAAGFRHYTGRTNRLQHLFFVSLTQPILVQVNLSDSKVYIGWIYSSLAQTELTDGYFEMLPLMSGYRDPTTRGLEITTKYSAEIGEAKRIASDERELRKLLRPFVKTIRLDDVQYAGEFDEAAYLKFSVPVERLARTEGARSQSRPTGAA